MYMLHNQHDFYFLFRYVIIVCNRHANNTGFVWLGKKLIMQSFPTQICSQFTFDLQRNLPFHKSTFDTCMHRLMNIQYTANRHDNVYRSTHLLLFADHPCWRVIHTCHFCIKLKFRCETHVDGQSISATVTSSTEAEVKMHAVYQIIGVSAKVFAAMGKSAL